MIGYSLLLFITDAAISFASGKYIDARIKRNRWGAVLWDFALSLVIAVNLVSFIHLGWAGVMVAAFGSALGTYLSFPRKRSP